VYCSADREFAELVFSDYERKTGVKVLALYDSEEPKTAGMTARLVAEEARPKADVVWSSDTNRALALVDQGLTTAYVPTLAAGIPERYKAVDGKWTGLAALIRFILYNPFLVGAADAPRSILDLTQRRWKGRFAIASPQVGTMSFQVAALFVKWGDAKARAFLRQLKDNGAVVAADNADVRDRVADGQVDVGLLDEDDAVVAVREKQSVAMVIPDQNGLDAIGTPLMPNVALLMRGAPDFEQGQRFIDYLVSPEAETILADGDAAQFPLHAGLVGPMLLPPLGTIRVMDVDYLEVARRVPAIAAVVRDIFGM
jgi:iron(III) transport system substrate-binding protein